MAEQTQTHLKKNWYLFRHNACVLDEYLPFPLNHRDFSTENQVGSITYKLKLLEDTAKEVLDQSDKIHVWVKIVSGETEFVLKGYLVEHKWVFIPPAVGSYRSYEPQDGSGIPEINLVIRETLMIVE